VLTEFVKAGAPEDILTEAHPHIGTFRLVTMVMSIRETIEGLGGEYRFGTRVEDFERDAGGRLTGLHLSTGEFLPAAHVILAVGHSARDTFEALHRRGIHVEAKPFAIGVRIEHPQSWIDKARYGPFAGDKVLGPAAYSPGPQGIERALGLFVLHVPGGPRGRRHQRGRPRRHQRDEPVFARRIQRQFGAGGGHQPGTGLSGRAAGGGGIAAASWKAWPLSRADRTIRRRGRRWGISWLTRLPKSSAWSPQATSRG
jgi:hypothetical protein